tara:strand:- start:38 stop:358 length:321 start_codon:yes stop_codon:yes gene_type:complete
MRQSRFTEAQIIGMIKEQEAGMPTAARSEVGISQAAMAEAIGVSPRAYHSYEKGQRGIPVEALIAMRERFEVDVPWLLLGTNAIRAGHDFNALKEIESSLDPRPGQ